MRNIKVELYFDSKDEAIRARTNLWDLARSRPNRILPYTEFRKCKYGKSCGNWAIDIYMNGEENLETQCWPEDLLKYAEITFSRDSNRWTLKLPETEPILSKERIVKELQSKSDVDFVSMYPEVIYGKSAPLYISDEIWGYLDERGIDCDGISVSIDIDIPSKSYIVSILSEAASARYRIDMDLPDQEVTIAVIKICDEFMHRRYNLNNFNKKENNNMASMNYKNYNTNPEFVPVNTAVSPIDLEFDKKIEDLEKEANDKIYEIHIALNKQIEDLNKERRLAHENESKKNRAESLKRTYDSYIAAGFTEEQAWKIMMAD